MGLANYHMQRSDFAKSISILAETIELSRYVDQVDQYKLIGILTDLAYAERLQGLLPQAEQHYRTALAMVMEVSKDELAIANSMFYLGSTLDQMGRYTESEPLIEAALEVHARLLGDTDPTTLFTRNGLACLYTHQMRLKEAKDLFADVIVNEHKCWEKIHLTWLIVQ